MDDKRRDLRAAYLRLFRSPDGEAVLADLDRRGFARASTFAPGDPYRTAYNEGFRGMVLHIRSMMEPRKQQEDQHE